MKKKTKIFLGLGIGAIGIGGGILLRHQYLESLPNDPTIPARDKRGDSYGSTRRPTGKVAVLAHDRDAHRMPTHMLVSKQHMLVSKQHTPMVSGVLEIKIKSPEVEIVYDEDYYKGHTKNRLAAEYRSGKRISHKRANQIMEWYAKDGPATRIRDKNNKVYDRVGETGSFYYKYLGTDEEAANALALGKHSKEWYILHQTLWVFVHRPFYHKNPNDMVRDSFGKPIGKTVAEVEAFLVSSEGAGKGAASSKAKDFLLNEGYTKVDADCDQKVKLINLRPGYYQIVAKPIWREHTQYWRFLKGYWNWTKYGPRAKSASVALDRFVSGDYCTNDLTYFNRITSANRWADISRIVEVKSNKMTTKYFRPLVTLEVTECGTKTNRYSRSFNAVCKSYKVSKLVMTKVYGGWGKFVVYLMEKFIGKMVKLT